MVGYLMNTNFIIDATTKIDCFASQFSYFLLTTCEEYNNNHGLQFSTDVNPMKSKTKCIAYLRKDREVKQLVLCGNKLPWVTVGKHVGQNITNKANGLKKRHID